MTDAYTWHLQRGTGNTPWVYRAQSEATGETEHFIAPDELRTFLSAGDATASQIASALADLENHEKNWRTTLELSNPMRA